MNEETDEEAETIRKNELNQELGPWKWQVLAELKRIATALERNSNENERTFNETNESVGHRPQVDADHPKVSEQKREACRRAGRASGEKRRIRNLPTGDPRRDAAKATLGLADRPSEITAATGRQLHASDSPLRPEEDGEDKPGIPSGKRTKTNVRSTKRTKSDGCISRLIAAYVSAWQQRYQTKARPDVGKAIGVFKALLQERSAGELETLLQVYCQMSDPWFETKRHDVVTFRENIGKIALAYDKGNESTAVNLKRVFGEADDESSVLISDGPSEACVGGEELP